MGGCFCPGCALPCARAVGWGHSGVVGAGGSVAGGFAEFFEQSDEGVGAQGGGEEKEAAKENGDEPEVEEAAGAVFGGVVGVVEDVDAFADFLDADGGALFSAGVALAVEGEAVEDSGDA